jgi:hypothetical protein
VNEENTSIVTAQLPDGSTIQIETSQVRGEEKVAAKSFDFGQVATSIQSIVDVLKNSLDKAKAKKTTVEFGIEIGAESGQLTALIVKGSGKANLKITLEWS